MSSIVKTIENPSEIITSLPTINPDSNYWLVRAQSGVFFDDFIANQYVGVGFDEVTLNDVQTKSKEQLLDIFNSKKPKDDNGNPIPKGTYTSWIGQVSRFSNEIRPGDYVLVPGISSSKFALGVVTGTPFELSVDELSNMETVANRKNSPYRKRIKVQFLKQFNRDEADPALYKMIYTQQTLSNINKYSNYILRASFDAYMLNNQLYLSFKVRQKADINAQSFTGFAYNMTKILSGPNDEQKSPIIKSNVQSQGVIQFILDNSYWLGPSLLFLVMVYSPKGIHVKWGNFELTKEDDKVIAQKLKNEETDRKIKETQSYLDIYREAKNCGDEIQTEISEEVINAVKTNLSNEDAN